MISALILMQSSVFEIDYFKAAVLHAVAIITISISTHSQ